MTNYGNHSDCLNRFLDYYTNNELVLFIAIIKATNIDISTINHLSYEIKAH